FCFEKRWLNDSIRMIGHGNGPEALPGLAVVFRALEPSGPGSIALNRGSREDRAISALKWFGPYGAEQAGRKLFGLAPSLIGMGGKAEEGCPTHWVRTRFVPKEERLVFRKEEHRVPAGRIGLLAGDFRLGPRFAIEARPPDLYIAIAFGPAAEPSRQEL